MNWIPTLLQIVAAIGIVASSLYYILCLWSAAAFLREHASRKECCPQPAQSSLEPATFLRPISILKPLKGIDPESYESFRSHCLQEYPEYEMIFGVSDPDDPAMENVKKLQREFPDRRIELMVCPEILGPNLKVSNLAQMLPQAHYDYLVVNDSDIRVDPDYLRRVTAPLADPLIAMVTCLYRGVAGRSLGSRLEALGIATDFCPGVLAAWQLEGGVRFGLGSTLAFRRIELQKMGGFIALVQYLADDYELGKRIASSSMTVELSDVVVETYLPPYSLREFLAHQLRWARGIRDARTRGYWGMVFTFGVLWALLALLASKAAVWAWGALAIVLLLRLAVGLLVGRVVLNDREIPKYLWMIPLRDLVAVAIWTISLFGRTVTWRGDRFRLVNGKLTRISP